MNIEIDIVHRWYEGREDAHKNWHTGPLSYSEVPDKVLPKVGVDHSKEDHFKINLKDRILHRIEGKSFEPILIPVTSYLGENIKDYSIEVIFYVDGKEEKGKSEQ
ncbi:MAG: hypothetical protein WD342_02920 [Verrucomicrobiales bacterium]